MLTIKYKRGLPFSCFRIWGHRTDLGNGGCFRGWKCNFGIYEPIQLCYTSKCSQKNLKGGYLTHLLGFEVTERIEEMEAVLEAENITLAFRNQYVLLTVLFLILWCTYVLYLFRNIKQQNKIMITKVTISALEQPLPTRSVIWPRILKREKGNPL